MNRSSEDSEMADSQSVWSDDVLDREGYALFLQKLLIEQSQESALRGAGLTIALDAEWGTGKTFFVTRWLQDLKNQGYPVVLFDAWQNDLGSEGATALMACMKAALDEQTQKLPKSKQIKKSAEAALQSAMHGFRKAVLPAAKVLATSLIKKTTGIAVEEIVTAVANNAETPNDIAKNAIDAAVQTTESGLDELFKHMLDEHSARLEAIKIFRGGIVDLLGILNDQTDLKLPLFVFVDEVDRCRPSYSIQLLEEIKHIFGMKHICFIVSTNLTQLRESIRVVYGSEFDSHSYLRRFFDLDCRLPLPNFNRFLPCRKPPC
ncbi:KAP family P-loop NTPase fold protein [Stenotrophobium rhamnosiphilum]|uniref:KAP NTPase domain-containing protein n=1 Tax=Stenotrophobium rhamnosiphilum TaxID=2029166 RepID=A0A2T5MK83_9GAMM|nr:P-loop NTPase fold protein [Stenotrophobium rhamnosiphilum]PTU32993.1 hypothetical protein CJD38_02445 [Stenotrophobium rhamnosiphilum]